MKRDRIVEFVDELDRMEKAGKPQPYRAGVSPLWAIALRQQFEDEHKENELRDAWLWIELGLPGLPAHYDRPPAPAPEEYVDGYYVGALFGVPMVVEEKMMGSFVIRDACQ